MSSAAAKPEPLGRSIWHAYPNFVVCVNDHLLAFRKADYRADMRRMSGHAFLKCEQCAPATYFFAVFSTTPDLHVTCYAISKESYDEWTRSEEPTPPTPEILYRLRDPEGRSLNPLWRPLK